ncbi:MAG: dCMP deaminase family protein [Puniceicoccales bacterium]|jgi:dCMP deaminase|nr:dCMP deaminase family protein [Puniceicoccales bacterium]
MPIFVRVIAVDFFDHFIHLVEKSGPRPGWDKYFLMLAKLISTRSPCQRLRVGCVIASGNDRGNRIIASGYNGFLPHVPHHSFVRDSHEMATVHAEQNAIADAAKRGAAIGGAIAYITHYPCVHCAKTLLAAGIVAVKYIDDYKNDPFVGELFSSCAVPICRIPLGKENGINFSKCP